MEFMYISSYTLDCWGVIWCENLYTFFMILIWHDDVIIKTIIENIEWSSAITIYMYKTPHIFTQKCASLSHSPCL